MEVELTSQENQEENQEEKKESLVACRKCNNFKDENQFYKIKNKRTGEKKINKVCKTCLGCSGEKRGPKHGGFQKLPLDTQNSIINDLKNKDILSIKKVALKQGVSYANLWSWINKGQIPKENV